MPVAHRPTDGPVPTRLDVSFGTVWEGIADALPEAVALRTPSETITYGEFERRAARLAAAMRRAGAGPGSTVACYLFNGPPYLETVFAAFKIGAVPVNANYRYRGAELTELLTDADVEVVVHAEALTDAVRHAAERVPSLRLLIPVGDGPPPGPGAPGDSGGPDAPGPDPGTIAPADHRAEPSGGPSVLPYAGLLRDHPPLPRQDRPGSDRLFMYTGGTTGRPKGVIWELGELLHGFSFATYGALGKPVPTTLRAAVDTAVELYREDTKRVCLPAVPLMHGTGLFNTFGTLLTAGEVVFTGTPALDPAAVWRTVARHRVTTLLIAGNAVAGPLVEELLAAESAASPHDLSSLRTLISSGTTFTDDLKAVLHEHADLVIYDGLAASEGGPFAFAVTTGPADLPSRFRPTPDTLVLDAEGEPRPPGDPRPGVLAFGGALPLGYHEDPQRTASTYRHLHGGRYVVVGDYVLHRTDGSLHFLGRGSAVINTGGEKVYPGEVEEAVLAHPAVRDAAVIGEPDPRWGERVAVVLTLVPGAGPLRLEELQKWLRPRVAGYKLPRRMAVVPDLPRTPTGKVEVSHVRALLNSASA